MSETIIRSAEELAEATQSPIEGNVRITTELKLDVHLRVTGQLIVEQSISLASLEASSVIAKAKAWLSINGPLNVKHYLESLSHVRCAGSVTIGRYIAVDGGGIKAAGDIQAGESIRGSYVQAHSIQAGSHIEAVSFVAAEKDLQAEGLISARDHIRAETIEATGYVAAGRYIKAPVSLVTGAYAMAEGYSITTAKLVSQELPLSRFFYAEMPPFRKIREALLGDSLTWQRRLKELTQADARRICRWNGWHPIVRAHLLMFYGLKKDVALSPLGRYASE